MKVAGQAVLHAPVERVWAALNDPAVLVRTIPGCQRLEATGPDAYAMTVTAGVASIKGTYAGTVALADLQRAELVRDEGVRRRRPGHGQRRRPVTPGRGGRRSTRAAATTPTRWSAA